MVNILFEIFSEEIPFSLQKQAELDVKNLWQEALLKNNINYKEIVILSTPRRLVSYLIGVDEILQDIVEEKKGPNVNAPANAIEGFLKANSITIEDCEIKNTTKGDFYYLNSVKKGGELKDFLANIVIDEILSKMKFLKSMRYNNSNVMWARPIRNMMLMLDYNDNSNFNNISILQGIATQSQAQDNANNIIDKNVSFINFTWGNVSSNNKTYGHRFLSKGELTITSISDYFKQLQNSQIMLGAKYRKNIIIKAVEKIASDNNCKVSYNEKLFEEVSYLVENVEILVGKIPSEYMKLPKELMINIIATNQRYINFLNLDNSLSEIFVIVSNMTTQDNGETIINGNKKVLEARLKDGLFFYNNDLQQPLIAKVENLKKINFFEGLGSLFDKKERVKQLFQTIFNEEQNLLCDIYKVDLTTSVVFEIPELQGIMGYYYALNNSYDETIAKAIAQQYSPQGPSDSTPSTMLGAKLAMLDKIDSISSLFAIGKKPTGSKDPFALRRAALGVIRIIATSEININLAQFLENDVVEFLKERLIFFMKDKGYDINLIQGIVASDNNCNILQIIKDINVLAEFFKTQNGEMIASCYKRVRNILDSYNINIKIDSNDKVENKLKSIDAINSNLLLEATEQELYKVAHGIVKQFEKSKQNNSINLFLDNLQNLSLKLNLFLDSIIINQSASEELKNNRLELLVIIIVIFNSVLPLNNIIVK